MYRLGVVADSSWWATPGAIVLVTGLVTVAATVIPLLPRPWVEGRIRRSHREEESIEDWLVRARELAVNLDDHLPRYQVGSLFDQPTIVLTSWETGGLRKKTALVVTFGPSSGLRKRGMALLNAIDLLHRRAAVLVRIRIEHPDRLIRALEDYEEHHGEAVYALRRFVQALGGPDAPSRDHFTLPLRSAGRVGNFEDDGA